MTIKKRFTQGTLSSLLPATALGGLLFGLPAHAIEVDLYGQGHLSGDYVDYDADSRSSVASNSSRLGVRGNHAFNDAYKVLFQYEAGVDLTGQGENDGNGPGSTNDLFTNARDSFVGIEGPFGTVLVGKLGGLNQWLYDYNLFADQVGDLGNIWGGTGLPGRVTNAVHYRTPDFSGLSVGLSYVPDEDADTTEDAAIIKADYATGSLKLGASYANLQQDVGDDWQVGALTGSYQFDRFNIGGGWQTEKNIAGVDGVDRDSFTVGGAMDIGVNGRIKTQYTLSSGDGSNSDASQWAIGYDHQINKYLGAYVAYARTTNDSGTQFTANNYGHGDAITPALGDNVGAISIGLVVKFDGQVFSR